MLVCLHVASRRKQTSMTPKRHTREATMLLYMCIKNTIRHKGVWDTILIFCYFVLSILILIVILPKQKYFCGRNLFSWSMNIEYTNLYHRKKSFSVLIFLFVNLFSWANTDFITLVFLQWLHHL